MRVLLRDRAKHDSGAVAILTAILTVALLVMSAFTIDFGMAYATKRQLSTAADSASLAGAAIYKAQFTGACTPAALLSQTLVRGNAEAAADAMFTANYPKGTALDGTISAVSCKGKGIEVVYSDSGKSDAPFGKFAGGSGTISTLGNAAASYAVSGRCSMCFLGPVDAGNADFSVSGGDTHVNGSVTAGPNSNWTADNTISVVGAINGGVFNPAATQGVIIPDPYASMVLPLSEAGLSTTKTNPCTQGPGVYGDFSIPNNCVLPAGAYVIKGTWDAKNNSLLSGTGVTLYVKKTGMIDFKNGAAQNLTAPVTALASPNPPGWPSGFVIIYDRDNVNVLKLQGNGNVTIKGIVYVPSSKIDFNGNSCLSVDHGAIVALGVVKANGNKACITITDAVLAGPGVPGNLQLTE